jgi:hypothetical protein
MAVDVMIRVLKNDVSGGFTNDLADAYTPIDLTNYTGNSTDWPIIIKNTPFNTIDEFKAMYKTGIIDVSNDPEMPFITTRRCRYFIDWLQAPITQTQAINNGWSEIDWSLFESAIVDAI